jgi:aspartyl-tRNA(Asn)/glutamyl-tRNA(Gln) amidotransferase subunit A
VPGDVYLRALQIRLAVRASIAALYAEHRLDAILAPTLPATAPRADDPVVRYPDGSEEPVGTAFTRFTTPWNTTGQPVVAVPCGVDADGLPIGLSFVGRPDAELDLCALANAYEQATPWHRLRPAL